LHDRIDFCYVLIAIRVIKYIIIFQVNKSQYKHILAYKDQ